MPQNARKHKNKKKQHQQKSAQQENNADNECRKLSSPAETSSETPSDIAAKSTAPLNAPPYKVENSSIVGRYIVANRDLKPGELLITEKPLAIGPCVSADAVCLGCYVPVELKPTQYRCPQCKWPLCGANCRGIGQSTGHTLEECTLFKLKNTVVPLNDPNVTSTTVKNLYELILIVRILLMQQHQPEKYATVLLMESHTEMRKKNAELWQHYECNVVARLRQEWQLEQFSPEQIHTICGILDVNCFEIGQLTAKARTLYPSAFLLAHDCSPNTSHTDDPQTFAIILRTSRAVKEDEAITLSYAYTLQGTLKRRDFMFAGKLFWCACQRCSDPFELGTDCSALVCAKCHKGSVRATDPLDQDAEWSCDSCEHKMAATDIVKILDKINNDLESYDVHDVLGLENFIKRYSSILRPNHYLLLSAKYSLCQIYGRIEGYLIHTMSMDDIKRKERYCREFLAIIDKLDPGLTRLRGLIMYELHAPIMILSQRLMLANQISKQDFQRNLKEVVRLLRESCDILKMEPVGSNEHQMGLAAEDALKRMGSS